MSHGIVEMNKSQAQIAGNVYTVLFGSDIDNGNFLVLGGLATGEFEAYNGVAPTAVATDELVLLYSPEQVYIPGQTKADFYNPAGKAIRAYKLAVGDEWTITDDMFANATVIGDYAIPVNGSTQLKDNGTTLPTTTRVYAKVIAKTFLGAGSNRKPATRIRFEAV